VMLWTPQANFGFIARSSLRCSNAPSTKERRAAVVALQRALVGGEMFFGFVEGITSTVEHIARPRRCEVAHCWVLRSSGAPTRRLDGAHD